MTPLTPADVAVFAGDENPAARTGKAPAGFSFFVLGTPKPKGSLKHVGRGRMVEQVTGSGLWRQIVAARAGVQRRGIPMLAGPVAVTATFVLERPKSHKADSLPVTRSSGDSDKLARNLLDALSGVLYIDDSQVIRLMVEKVYGSPSGVQVDVRPVSD